MDEEGLRHDFYTIAALTREGVTYRTAAGETRAVFEPPHRVTPDEARGFVEWLQQYILQASLGASWQASWLVCSGSSPDPSCDGVYRELIARAGAEGLSTVLDSYGEAFRLGLESRPTLVKPNRSELEQTFGLTLRSSEDYGAALRTLLESASYALITDGGAPFYAGSPGGLWRCTPPQVRAVNSTGSGDSMLAAVIWALAHGRSFEEALQLGAAAGASNAGVWQVAASSKEEILQLLPGVGLERLG
jgi:fructose-1-phosphate kinase PfkB-like protein